MTLAQCKEMRDTIKAENPHWEVMIFAVCLPLRPCKEVATDPHEVVSLRASYIDIVSVPDSVPKQ
jgi:hypothetical protein